MASTAADDINTERREALHLIAALQLNYDAGERATGLANTRLLHETRCRAPQRLWPRIGERVVADMPSRAYKAAVFMLLDMQSPPEGPYIPAEPRCSSVIPRGPLHTPQNGGVVP